MFGKKKEDKLKIENEYTTYTACIGPVYASIKSDGTTHLSKGVHSIFLTAKEWESVDEYRYRRLRKEQ